MAGAKGIRAGRAYVEIGAYTDPLKKALNNVGKSLKDFGKRMAGIGAGLTAASGAVLGPLAGAASHFAASGDELTKMSNKTGASVESLSELRHAASKSAVDFGTLGKSINKNQRLMAEAMAGNETAQESFAKLGLSAEALSQLPVDQQFEAIAQAISQIDDPAQRTAAAMEMFGKSGAEMMPLMMDGAAGIKALRQEARDLGLQVSTEDASNATLLGDTWANVMTTIKDVIFEVGAAIAPVLIDIMNMVIPIITTFASWVSQNRQLVVIVAAVAAGIGILGAAFMSLGIAAAVTGAALTGLATVIGVLTSPMAIVIGLILTAGAAFFYFTDAGAAVVEWFSSSFGELLGIVGGVLQGVWDAIAAGNWELAAQIMWKALQIAWQAGIGKIMTIWTGFKMGVFEIFDSLITGIRSIWNNITTWIADKIAWIIGGVSKLIESITGFQLIADTTMADMRKAIQEDNAAFQQQLQEGRARRTNERDQAVMQVKQQYDTSGLQGELDELNKLTKQAAQERATAEVEAAQQKEFQKQAFELDTEDLMAQAAGSTGKADAVLGTFSGATAGQQIGASSVWGDIAKSNREIADAVKKTEKNTREKAGWFAT